MNRSTNQRTSMLFQGQKIHQVTGKVSNINYINKGDYFYLDNLHKDQLQKDGVVKETIKYVEHNGQKYIVDGHHRARAAKELGFKVVPVEKVELPFKGYNTIDDVLMGGH